MMYLMMTFLASIIVYADLGKEKCLIVLHGF